MVQKPSLLGNTTGGYRRKATRPNMNGGKYSNLWSDILQNGSNNMYNNHDLGKYSNFWLDNLQQKERQQQRSSLVSPDLPLPDVSEIRKKREEERALKELKEKDNKKEDDSWLENLGDGIGNSAKWVGKVAWDTVNVPIDLARGITGFQLDKDPDKRTLAEDLGASWTAGSNLIGKSLAGTSQYVGDKTGNEGFNKFGEDFSEALDKREEQYQFAPVNENGFEASDLADPKWYTQQVARQVPNMAVSIIPGLAATRVAQAANKLKGLPKHLTNLAIFGGTSGSIDSLLEAGHIYEEAEQKGVDPEQAFEESFGKNLALNVGLNATQYGAAFSKLNKLVGNMNNVAEVATRASLGAGVEALQEGSQGAINASVLDEEFDWTSNENVEAMVIGALMGGTTTGVMSLSEQAGTQLENNPALEGKATEILEEVQSRTEEQMTSEERERFDRAIEVAKRNGMEEQDAVDYAWEDFAQNSPSGIEKIKTAFDGYKQEKQAQQETRGTPKPKTRLEYASQFHVGEEVTFNDGDFSVADISEDGAITLEDHMGNTFTPNTLQVQKKNPSPETTQQVQESMQKEYDYEPEQKSVDGIEIGDNVMVNGFDVAHEVVDNSDPSLITVKTPFGAEMKVGRANITEVEGKAKVEPTEQPEPTPIENVMEQSQTQSEQQPSYAPELPTNINEIMNERRQEFEEYRKKNKVGVNSVVKPTEKERQTSEMFRGMTSQQLNQMLEEQGIKLNSYDLRNVPKFREGDQITHRGKNATIEGYDTKDSSFGAYSVKYEDGNSVSVGRNIIDSEADFKDQAIPKQQESQTSPDTEQQTQPKKMTKEESSKYLDEQAKLEGVAFHKAYKTNIETFKEQGMDEYQAKKKAFLEGSTFSEQELKSDFVQQEIEKFAKAQAENSLDPNKTRKMNDEELKKRIAEGVKKNILNGAMPPIVADIRKRLNEQTTGPSQKRQKSFGEYKGKKDQNNTKELSPEEQQYKEMQQELGRKGHTTAAHKVKILKQMKTFAEENGIEFTERYQKLLSRFEEEAKKDKQGKKETDSKSKKQDNNFDEATKNMKDNITKALNRLKSVQTSEEAVSLLNELALGDKQLNDRIKFHVKNNKDKNDIQEKVSSRISYIANDILDNLENNNKTEADTFLDQAQNTDLLNDVFDYVWNEKYSTEETTQDNTPEPSSDNTFNFDGNTFKVEQSEHSKTGEPIWIVRSDEKVNFTDVNKRFREEGARYYGKNSKTKAIRSSWVFKKDPTSIFESDQQQTNNEPKSIEQEFAEEFNQNDTNNTEPEPSDNKDFKMFYEMSKEDFMNDDGWKAVNAKNEGNKQAHYIVMPNGEHFKVGWAAHGRTEEKAKANFHKEELHWKIREDASVVTDEAVSSYPDLKRDLENFRKTKEAITVTEENVSIDVDGETKTFTQQEIPAHLSGGRNGSIRGFVDQHNLIGKERDQWETGTWDIREVVGNSIWQKMTELMKSKYSVGDKITFTSRNKKLNGVITDIKSNGEVWADSIPKQEAGMYVLKINEFEPTTKEPPKKKKSSSKKSKKKKNYVDFSSWTDEEIKAKVRKDIDDHNLEGTYDYHTRPELNGLSINENNMAYVDERVKEAFNDYLNEKQGVDIDKLHKFLPEGTTITKNGEELTLSWNNRRLEWKDENGNDKTSHPVWYMLEDKNNNPIESNPNELERRVRALADSGMLGVVKRTDLPLPVDLRNNHPYVDSDIAKKVMKEKGITAPKTQKTNNKTEQSSNSQTESDLEARDKYAIENNNRKLGFSKASIKDDASWETNPLLVMSNLKRGDRFEMNGTKYVVENITEKSLSLKNEETGKVNRHMASKIMYTDSQFTRDFEGAIMQHQHSGGGNGDLGKVIEREPAFTYGEGSFLTKNKPKQNLKPIEETTSKPKKKSPSKVKADKDAYQNAEAKKEWKDDKGTWKVNGLSLDAVDSHSNKKTYTLRINLEHAKHLKNPTNNYMTTFYEGDTKETLNERLKYATNYKPKKATLDKIYKYVQDMVGKWNQVEAHYKEASKKEAKKKLDEMHDTIVERYKNNEEKSSLGGIRRYHDTDWKKWTTNDEWNAIRELQREYEGTYLTNQNTHGGHEGAKHLGSKVYDTIRNLEKEADNQAKKEQEDRLSDLMDTDPDFRRIVSAVVRTGREEGEHHFLGKSLEETAYRLYGFPKNQEQYWKSYRQFLDNLREYDVETWDIERLARENKDEPLPPVQFEYERDQDEWYFNDKLIDNGKVYEVKKVGTKYLHVRGDRQILLENAERFKPVPYSVERKDVSNVAEGIQYVKELLHNLERIPNAPDMSVIEIGEFVNQEGNGNLRDLIRNGSMRSTEKELTNAYEVLLDASSLAQYRNNYRKDGYLYERYRDEYKEKIQKLEDKLSDYIDKKTTFENKGDSIKKGDFYVNELNLITEADKDIENPYTDTQYVIKFEPSDLNKQIIYLPENKYKLLALDYLIEQAGIKNDVNKLVKNNERQRARELITKNIINTGYMNDGLFVFASPRTASPERLHVRYKEGNKTVVSKDENFVNTLPAYFEHYDKIDEYKEDATKAKKPKEVYIQYVDGNGKLTPKDKAELIAIRFIKNDLASSILKDVQKRKLKSHFSHTEKTVYLMKNAGSEKYAKDVLNKYADGETEPEQPKAKIVKGKEGTAATERGTEIKFDYAVVSADDLIASHGIGLEVNPDYPKELQPRDRSRYSSLEQVTRISQKLNPDFLGENPKASDGAPIIYKDRVVESGNGRTIAIKKAYKRQFDSAETYRNWLFENKDKFGLSDTDIAEVQDPILVRVRKNDVDREQFVKEANESSVSTMSVTERAISDAEQLNDNHLSVFYPADDGNIQNAENRDFIQAFIRDIVADTERNNMYDKNGRLSQNGVNRIKNAVFQKAYGNVDAISIMAESTDNNVKNMTNAMLVLAPEMVRVQNDVNNETLYDLSISNEISNAVVVLSDLRNQGESVGNYLEQTSLFGDELTNTEKEILQIFDSNQYKRSAKRMIELFKNYNRLVEELGNPSQMALFEDEAVPTKEELLETAINVVQGEGTNEELQTDLFSDEDSSSTETSTTTEESEKEVKDDISGLTSGSSTNTVEDEVSAYSEEQNDGGTNVSTSPKVTNRIGHRLATALNTVARKGHVRMRSARGTYNFTKNMINIQHKDFYNLRVVAHELGHAFETFIPKLNEAEMIKASRLYPQPLKTKQLKIREGLAEYFQLYIRDYDKAKDLAPDTTKTVDDLIQSNKPLREAFSDVRKWIEQDNTKTPLAKAMGTIRYSNEKPINSIMGNQYQVGQFDENAPKHVQTRQRIKGTLDRFAFRYLDLKIPFRDLARAVDGNLDNNRLLGRLSLSGGAHEKARTTYEGWARDSFNRFIINYRKPSDVPNYLRPLYDDLMAKNPETMKATTDTKERIKEKYKLYRKKQGLSEQEAKQKAVLEAISSRSLQEIAYDGMIIIENGIETNKEVNKIIEKLVISDDKKPTSYHILSGIMQSYRYAERYARETEDGEKKFKVNPISKEEAYRVIEFTREHLPEVENIVREYTNNLSEIILEKSLKGGLIDAQTKQRVKNGSSFYIPTYYDRHGRNVVEGQRDRKTSGKPVKAYKGDQAPILDFLSASMNKLIEVEQAIEMKQVLNELETTFKSDDEGKTGRFGQIITPKRIPKLIQGESIAKQMRDLFQDDTDVDVDKIEEAVVNNVFQIFAPENLLSDNGKPVVMNPKGNGKNVYIELEKDLYKAISSMKPVFASTLVRGLSHITSNIRYAMTALSPTYLFNAFNRDVWTAQAQRNTKAGEVQFYKDLIKGMTIVAKGDKELSDKYVNSGAFMSASEDILRSFRRKDATQGLLPTKNPNVWRMKQKAGRNKLIYFVNPSNILQMQEQMTRYGQFQQMVSEKARAYGISEDKVIDGRVELTKEEQKIVDQIYLDAAVEASEVTVNFRTHGTSEAARQYIPLTNFLTGSIQGMYRELKEIKRQGFDKGSRRLWKRLAKGMIPLTLISWAMNQLGDDEFEDVSSEIRDRYWLIPTPFGYLSIAKPHSYAVPLAYMERFMDEYMDDQDARSITEDWSYPLKHAFGIPIMPIAMSTVLDVQNNKAWYGGYIVNPWEEKLPTMMQYDADTSTVAKLQAEAWFKLANLGKEQDEMTYQTGLSPKKFDYLVRGLFGKAGEAVVGMLGGDGAGDNYSPSTFFLEDGEFGSRMLSQFYNELDRLEGEHDVYGEEGKPKSELRDMRKLSSVMSDINKMKKELNSVDDLNAKQKTKLTEKLTRARKDIARFGAGSDVKDITNLKEVIQMVDRYKASN